MNDKFNMNQAAELDKDTLYSIAGNIALAGLALWRKLWHYFKITNRKEEIMDL